MAIENIAAANGRFSSSQVGSIVLYGTFGLLMFGPAAFGAVEPWSIFIVEAGATLLLLLWVARQWLDGELKIRWNPLFLPMLAFGFLILLQVTFNVSAYRHDTISGGLLYCAYAILCFLAGQVLIRGSQARKLALVFSIYGAALAAFALLQGVSSNGKLYWIRQPRLGGWIYGPYVNHNHYAGLMELLIPIPLVLSLTHLARSNQRITAACAAALMAGTIFLSGSRGGMVALVAELAVLAFVLIKQRRGWRTALTMGIFLLLLGGILTWLGGEELSQRMTILETPHSEVSNSMRLQIDRDAFHMFLRRPVLGWGLGAFPVAYPQFRTFYTNFFVNEAHNDYLQLLVETGALGFGTMVWFLVVLYRQAVKKVGNWTTDISGAVTLACLLGLSGILVHSAVDFNLQVPANAALFYVLCTVASSDPFVQPVRKRRLAPTQTETVLPASEVV